MFRFNDPATFPNLLVNPPTKLLACPVRSPTFKLLVILLIFCVILPVSLLISKLLAKFVSLSKLNPDVLIFDIWSVKLLKSIPVFCSLLRFVFMDLISIEFAINLFGSKFLTFSRSDNELTFKPSLFNFSKSLVS